MSVLHRTAAMLAVVILALSLLTPGTAHAAARSVNVRVLNRTDFNLYRQGANLSHGVWGQRTPGIIGDEGRWASESNGVMTGTAGWAQYRLVDFDGEVQAWVTVEWSNPYAGSNSYRASVTRGSGYSIGYYGGHGDNAGVTFVLLAGNCQVDPDNAEISCTSA
jgi:hypothetical protein